MKRISLLNDHKIKIKRSNQFQCDDDEDFVDIPSDVKVSLIIIKIINYHICNYNIDTIDY